MNFLIVLLVLGLLPSIHANCATKTVFPLIYGRKEIDENVILHDMKNTYEGNGYLLGGEYVDNSSSTIKGFLMYTQQYGDPYFKYVYSTGTQDIIKKVAIKWSSYFGAGVSGTGSSTSFFAMKTDGPWNPPQVRQIGGNTSAVDPSSEIGKSSFKNMNLIFSM